MEVRFRGAIAWRRRLGAPPPGDAESTTTWTIPRALQRTTIQSTVALELPFEDVTVNPVVPLLVTRMVSLTPVDTATEYVLSGRVVGRVTVAVPEASVT